MQVLKCLGFIWRPLTNTNEIFNKFVLIFRKKKVQLQFTFQLTFGQGCSIRIQRINLLCLSLFFEGDGRDGDGDGVANPENPQDGMAALSVYLHAYANREKGLEKALFNFYEREETVNQIMAIAKIYERFQTISLEERAFPLPTTSHYSYRGTWGVSRGWGGRRIHEGTDLFAGYGVPVRSTSYGVIEAMGWNDYGGWRVGIRDMHNTYHYYAHLSGFNKEFKEGDIVEPGAIIGYVGSSGYGKEGTSGRFPPHLHYGMYKYNGRTEWAFDPYPYLRIWEQQGK